MKLMLDRLVGVCGFLLAAGVLLCGCATSPEPVFNSDPASASATAGVVPVGGSAGASAPKGTNTSVVFNVTDQIKVTFSGPPDPPLPHEERIKDDGTISLKWIGSVKAAGKTPGELQITIHDLYVPKYYKDLNVIVDWLPQERFYSIGGEIRSPGLRVWSPDTTVVKAVQSSGDFTEFANRRGITVLRANGAKFKVDFKKAITDPKYDLKVLPQDIINVPRTRW